MSARLGAKISLALASTAIALLAAHFFLHQRPRTTVKLRLTDAPLVSNRAAPMLPSGLRLAPLDSEEIRFLAPELPPWQEYDPQTRFRLRAHAHHEYFWPEHPRGKIAWDSNALGLRGSREVREDRPEIRILVAGDSHSEGVCYSEETHIALLERMLVEQGRDVEALNACVGGHSFYEYLGTLERYRSLSPDVFFVAVYGGNDFYDALPLWHFFEGSVMPLSSEAERDQIQRAIDLWTSAMAQGLASAHYFHAHADQIPNALAAARGVSAEIAARCAQAGIVPVFAYIPPVMDAGLPVQGKDLEEIASLLGLSSEDRRIHDQIGDMWIEAVQAMGAAIVDLRPAFRAASVPPYWVEDLHLNLQGHRLVAEALAPIISRLCPPGFKSSGN